MSDLSHYEAIQLRLSHERARLERATKPREVAWREHECRMIERELASEVAFLAARGIAPPAPDEFVGMSDDELLAALGDLDSLLAKA